MTARRPLVRVGGKTEQLPTGDSLDGILDTPLSDLTNVQGAPFSNTNTIGEALQKVMNGGLGGTGTYPETLDNITNFDELWDVPIGKPFMVTGGSSVPTNVFLVASTTGSTYVYTTGNSNTRDLFVKVANKEWAVSGTTQRKIYLLHHGQSTVGGVGTSLTRCINFSKNMSTLAVLCTTERYADQASIPTYAGNGASNSSPWLSGMSSKITNFSFNTSKTSNSTTANVHGYIEFNAEVSIGETVNVWSAVAQATTLFPSPLDANVVLTGAKMFFSLFSNTTGLPLNASLLLFQDSSNLQTLSVINGAAAIPAGTVFFNGSYRCA